LYNRTVPLRDNLGNIIKWYAAAYDIEDRKRAEMLLRDREQQLRQLLEKVVHVQEDERKRLARELHDETGQSLMSLLVGLCAIQDSETLSHAKEQAAHLRTVASRAMEETQRLAQGLRPMMLDDMGLEPALKRYASDFAQAYGVAVSVDTIGLKGERLPAQVETALFRIAQEALTNIAKHAAAQHVNILLSRHLSDIQMIVEDDGVGFASGYDSKTPIPSNHLGLYGMRERVGMLGGVIAFESMPGQGTVIHVRVPVPLERQGK
jgi:signal transduction histidine kinase